MPHLSLSLLGSFQAWTANGAMQSFRTLKERALLAYLAVENNRTHRREALAELFWPDRPEGIARNNLRQALYGIRQMIGEEGYEAIFQASADEVKFNLGEAVWLDVEAFEVHWKASQQHIHNTAGPCSYCLQHLRNAVEIYRGAFLEDVFLDKNQEFQDWLIFRREQYFRMQCQALEQLVTDYEKMGDFPQAVLYATRQVELDDLKERLYSRLMLLLAKAGRSSAALEVYETCQRKIHDILGGELAPETVLLAQKIREGYFDPDPAPVQEVPHNLPQPLTPFIGREMELAQIAHAFETPACRLVTLVGAGGVGKSRLAVQAALMHMKTFANGVYFISLEGTLSSDGLPDALGRALGLAPGAQQSMRATLFDFLRPKHVLLVLDNFEQLMEGRSLLIDMLQAAPFLKILVTSRERLHLQAECLIDLQGLSFPVLPSGTNGHAVDADNMTSIALEADAVQLLLERASRVRSSARRNGRSVVLETKSGGAQVVLESRQEIEAAVKICQLVEGLPLGIELAASWGRDFTFDQIADEVQRSLDFLQSSFHDLPERHRSLRASFEHSWELLSESEREIFCKLAVFPGRFTVQAAQEVAGAAIPWLMQLEDKSLVRRVAFGRYDLHPLLRQFAAQKLRQYSRRVEDQANRQHAVFFCHFLSERNAALKGGRMAEALDEVEADLENIRVAWDWAISHRAADSLGKAAAALMTFYEARSRWQEGEGRFASAVHAFETGTISPLAVPVVAYLVAVQGWFCCRLSRFQQSEALLLRSLEMLKDQPASAELAFAHFALGFLYTWMSRFQEALKHLTTSSTMAETIGDDWSLAWTRELLTEIIFESGQIGYQEGPFLETLALFERINEQRGSSRALNYLGNIALAQSRYTDARVYFEKLLAKVEKLGDVWGAAGGYSKLGQLAAARGEYDQAWKYYQRSLAMLQKTGDRRRTGYTLRELGETAEALGKRAEAKQYFHQALEIASETRSEPLAADILTGIAALLMRNVQTVTILQLLELVLAQPAGDQLTISRAKRLLESARASLPSQGTVPIQSPYETLWDAVEQFLHTDWLL